MIFCSRRHRRVFTIVPPCCWTLKMCLTPLELRCRQLFKMCTLSYLCFRYHTRHFDFRFHTVGFFHSVTSWAAAATSTFLENSESTLCSFPYVKYASCFKGYQIFQFSTKKFIYPPPFPVPPFHNRLDYIRKLNVILSAMNWFRITPKRIKKFRRGIELFQKNLVGVQHLHPPAVRGLKSGEWF